MIHQKKLYLLGSQRRKFHVSPCLVAGNEVRIITIEFPPPIIVFVINSLRLKVNVKLFFHQPLGVRCV